MAAKIIDGKAIAEEIKSELAADIAELRKDGIMPGLAVVLVGENPASQVYVRQKEKACGELGIASYKHERAASISEDELLQLVETLNADPEVDGILVQLPLPEHIDSKKVLAAIDPAKDIDGFHPVNIGNLVIGEPLFVPCTPAGILELLKRTGVELKGKEAVIVGRSNIVGKPVALLLLQEHATVTICHTRTRDLGEVTRRAEVLVVAAGRPQVVTADMVSDGVVVIDVGVNRLDDKLVGDVDFEGVKEKAAAITPVPGGVGPMTIAMLMSNTVRAAKNRAAARTAAGR